VLLLATAIAFGFLVESGSPWALSAGYPFAATLMPIPAAIEAKFGIDAEMRSLESIADPLSSGVGEGRTLYYAVPVR
jgi:hypothetical protein